MSFNTGQIWGYASPYCAHPSLGPLPEDGFYGAYQEDDQGNRRVVFDCSRTREGITVNMSGVLHIANPR